MSCKAHYKGQAFDSIEKAIEAVKADHGTTLEATASKYYETYRELATSKPGSQEDLDAFSEYIKEESLNIRKGLSPGETAPNRSSDIISLDNLNLEEEFDSLPFEEGQQTEEAKTDSEKVQDYNQTAQQRKLTKEGLSDFLVVDKLTNSAYNANKQSQVVDSIVYSVTSGMRKGLTAKQAFEKTKEVFEKRRTIYNTAAQQFENLTQKQKDDLNIKSVDDANELYEEYDKVLRNWTQFEKHSKRTLLKLFGIADNSKLENLENSTTSKDDAKDQTDETPGEGESLDGFEEIDSNLERISFDDGAVFRIDGKDTASARLRLFIALRKSPNRSFLNLSTFMDFDSVYDELQTILSGVEPTFDAFMSELAIYSINKPYLKELIKELQEESTQVKNEFVSNFSNHHQAFLLSALKTGKRESDGSTYYSYSNMASNRYDVVKTIQSQWVENQKISPMVINKNGVLVINKTEAKKFAEKVEELATTEDIDSNIVQILLQSTGIEMSIDAIEHFKKESVSLTNMSFKDHFKKGGIFKYIADSLNSNDETKDVEVDSQLDLNNPLTGVSSEGTSISMLAKIEGQFSESIRSNSHKDIEGKTIFSYGLNNHLSHTIRKLLKNNGSNLTVENLSKLSFSARSKWLQEIKENKEFRDAFGLFYLDGFKKQGPGQKGKKRSKQSRREMELQFISMFQNNGNKQAYFIYPTISDKSTTPIIRALKQNLGIRVSEDGEVKFERDTIVQLQKVLLAEFDRIEKYRLPEEKSERYSGYDNVTEVFSEDGESSTWKGGALNIYTFPELNEFLQVNRNSDGSFVIPADNRKQLLDMLLPTVKNMIYEKVKNWERLGIVTDKILMFDSKYLSNTVSKINPPITDPNTGIVSYVESTKKQIATYAAAEMEINYIIANSNIKQLITGDPATHYKKGIDQTIDEYTKRLAKDIAPGKDGVFETNNYNVVFFNDLIVDSKSAKSYAETLSSAIGKAYEDVNVTDAQEYTTLQEHIDVMRAYGKIKDSIHSSITKKITDAKESGKEYKLTEEELKVILQPMKPVQTYNKADFNRDVNIPIYIKSSSFPLIPEFTKGTELDKIRVEMEANNIQRAAYVSAVKVGAKNVLNIWDGRNIKKDFSLKGKSTELSREGFRIQQEVPYKEDKVKITTVTQMNKLLFESILHIDGMKELRKDKETIRKKLFERGLKKWYEKIGAEISEDADGKPTMTIKDLTKLKNALIEEAIDRGYPLNDIQSLEVKDGKFITPLSFNSSAKKFEALLMSMLSNSAVKHKMGGKSYVQGSAAGVLTGATTGKSWSELTDKELGSIIFTDSADLDMSTGLKYIRLENGIVKPAQLILPFHFRGKDGKRLNTSDYTKVVNGKTVLDTSKIDPELLRMIGARIPNQGHSSMLPIEVVGFLPESMGDLIIVPEEITKQMGADFDVDKLFVYQYNYKIDKNTGALTKAKQREVSQTKVSKSEIKMGDITFNEQQAEAYHKIMNWNKGQDPIFTLEGYAGTGKTTIIKKIIEDIKKENPSSTKILVSAPTHKAKGVISKSTKEEAITLHSLLGLAPNMDLDKFSSSNIIFDAKRKPLLNKASHVIIDEASMINSELYDFLLAKAKAAGVKIIFMGDPAQLPPVGEVQSKVFSNASNKAILTKVERQADGNPLGPIYDAIRSNIESPLDMFVHKTQLNEKGEGLEIISGDERTKFVESFLKDFKKNPLETKLLTWTNADVSAFNNEVRNKLFPNSNAQFNLNEPLLFYKSITKGGDTMYENSEEVTISEIKEDVIDGIEVFKLTLGLKPSITVLKNTPKNLALYKSKAFELFENAKRIKKETGKGSGWTLLDQFSNKIIPPIDIVSQDGEKILGKGIDYGYAMTVHKSQGSTYDNVYVNEMNIDRNSDATERNKLKYVAFSRPRTKTVSLTNKTATFPIGVAKPGSKIEEIKENIILEDTEKSLQNDYIDIHWKVLTHPEVLPRILEPLDKRGEFSISEESKKIKKIRQSSAKTRSPLGTDFNISTFSQNAGGKTGVGVFALASTFNSIIQGYNLQLGYEAKGAKVLTPLEMFDGFSLVNLSGPGNNKNGNKGSNISDVLSASVDNAKEQTLDTLNLNGVTFNAAVAMLQLSTESGKNLDITYVTRLLSQKILFDYVELLGNINDSTTTEFFPTRDSVKREAVKRIKEKYLKGREEKQVNLNKAGITPDMMIKAIENENENDVEWVDNQITFLNVFLEFDTIGAEIKNLQSALNTDSKGLEPTYFKVLNKSEKISNLKNSPMILGLKEFISDNGEFIEYSKASMLAIDVYSKLFPQGSQLVENILNYYKKEFGLDTMSPELSQEIFDNLKSYLIINKNTITSDIDSLRKRLLIDSEENKSIATRVKEAKSTWGKEDFLLRRLLPIFPDVVGDPVSIEYVASTEERFDEQKNIQAFIQMLGSPDPEIKSLAEDLVSYLFITGGAQSASNFQKFVPIIHLKSANISKRLSDISWKSDSIMELKFFKQFLQHNPDLAPALPKEVVVKKGRFILKHINELAEQEDLPTHVIKKTDELGTKYEYVPAFKLYDTATKSYRLFMRSETIEKGVLFEEVDIAGGNKGIKEYGNGVYVKTMFNKNKTEESKTVPIVVPTVPLNGIQRPSSGAMSSLLGNYGLSEESSPGELKAALEKIASESSNDGFKELAKVLIANFDSSKPVRFTVDTQMAADGKYKYLADEESDLVKINTNLVKSKSEFERVLLHEMIHAQTAHLIYLKENGVNLPTEITRHLNSITALRNSIISSLSPEQRAEYDSFILLSPEEKISSNLSRSSKFLYYALMSDAEFITQTLTGKEVQAALNEMPFNSKQTKLQRLVEILSNLYKALAEQFGISVKKDSTLEAALGDVLNLLTEVKNYNISGINTDPTKSTLTQSSEFINHSGGAYGGDTFWDLIGREFGITDHRHYKDAGNQNVSQKLKNAGVKPVVLTKEQMDIARAEVERLLGQKYSDTLQGNLQVRNYYQVANSDGVFAIAKLHTSDSVLGGTNTAVQLGIKLNKPVYVWDISTEKWHVYNTVSKQFEATETPTLTKNFAGVGSRDIENYNTLDKDTGKWTPRKEYIGAEKESKAKQAIRDVYKKTLSSENPTQQSTESPFYDALPLGNKPSDPDTHIPSSPGKKQEVVKYLIGNSPITIWQKVQNRDGSRKDYSNYVAAVNAAKAINKDLKFKVRYQGVYSFKATKAVNPLFDPLRVTGNIPAEVYTLELYEDPLISKPNISIGQDSLEFDSLGFEDAIDPAIQKTIDQLENSKTYLKRKHAQEKGDKLLFQERINVIDSQIEMLKEENSIRAVELVANAQIAWAETLLSKPTISISEISEVLRVADAWTNIRELFHGDYSDVSIKKISLIESNATTLKLNTLKIAQKLMYQITKEGTSAKIVEEDMQIMRDTNVGTASALDISRIDNPAVQKLAEMLHNAARDTNLEFTKIEKSIATAFEKFKQTEEYKRNGFGILLQKDENGNWTGNLAVRYSQAYYNELKRQKAIRTSNGQDGWKRYFKWRRENEILIDPSVLFNSDGTMASGTAFTKHVAELEAEFGKARADEMIQQAFEKYSQYLIDLQIMTDSIEADGALAGNTEEEIKNRISAWVVENSPLVYVNNYKGASVIKGVKLQGHKYVVSKPRKTINGKETGWYDSNFEQIENNPEVLEFYNFYRDMMKELRSNLPDFENEALQSNFIPSIKSDLIENYTKGGLTGALAGLYDGFIDTMAPIEPTTVSKDKNPKTGVVNKRVPIRFTNDMSPQEKSTNMIKNLELFALMSLNYKHKTKTEDAVLLMRRIIAEAKEQKTTFAGKDIEGYIVDDSTKLKNTQNAVDLAIDAALYGERRNKGTATRVILADKLLDSRKATLVAKKIKNLRKKHAAGLIEDQEFEKQHAELLIEQEKYGGRAITDVDIVDWAIKITQLKGMAFNAFSATTNMTYGILSNFLHAAGGEDFSTKQASKAWSMMLASTSKSLGLNRVGVAKSSAMKINNMIRVVDLLFDVNEAAHSGDTKAREKSSLSKLSPYELQKRSEYFIQGQSMIALMLNTTKDSNGNDFTDSSGKKINLFEAFAEDGTIRDDVNLGEGWEGGIDSEAFKKFRNHIIQLNKRIHGNYDPNSFIGMKKTMVGRAAMQFRTWIGEGFATRFEAEKFDRQLDRNVKGTYRTLYDLGFLDTIKGFIKIGMFQGGSLKGISNVDAANLKKAFAEMNVLIGLIIAGMLVSGLKDDDDEEEKANINIVLNQLYRLQSDLTFFDNPTSFDQIMSNIIPAVNVVADFGRALSKTVKFITQDEEEEDGRSLVTADKLMLAWTKAIPFASQINKIETNTKKLRPH